MTCSGLEKKVEGHNINLYAKSSQPFLKEQDFLILFEEFEKWCMKIVQDFSMVEFTYCFQVAIEESSAESKVKVESNIIMCARKDESLWV